MAVRSRLAGRTSPRLALQRRLRDRRR
jgi:hypothetical protein